MLKKYQKKILDYNKKKNILFIIFIVMIKNKY
jgi:hypothetical protein